MSSEEQIKPVSPLRPKGLDSGQYKRQAIFADNEKLLFMQEAKKKCIVRFHKIVKKYDIIDDDIEELIEISGFLL